MPSPPQDSSIIPSLQQSDNMSQATREVLARVRRMIPPMLDKFHKGLSS